MRINVLVIILISNLILLNQSCNRKTIDTDQISISPSKLDITKDAGSFELSVESSSDWELNISATWCTANTYNGTHNNIIKINYTENTTTEKRNALIVISDSNGKSKDTLVVNQEATLFLLIVNPKFHNAEKEAGSIVVSVTTETNWQIINNIEWCNVSTTSGNQNGTFTINYDENTTTKNRTDSIIVKGENSNSESIIITQKGKEVRCYITKETLYNNDQITTTTYIYDNNNNVIEKNRIGNWTTVPSQYTYEYNSNGDIEYISYYYDNELKSYTVFEYDLSEHFLKRSIYEKNTEQVFQITRWITFKYNSQNEIIETYHWEEGQNSFSYYCTYNYDNVGNVSQMYYYDKNSSGDFYKLHQYDYTYDDKKSTYLFYIKDYLPKINNWTRSDNKRFNENGDVTSASITSYSFEYNGNDFPTKRTYLPATYTIYEYNCIIFE